MKPMSTGHELANCQTQGSSSVSRIVSESLGREQAPQQIQRASIRQAVRTCATDGCAGELLRLCTGGGSKSSGIGLSSIWRKLGSGSDPKNGARGGWNLL